jgi:hypothetical protein
MRTDLKERFAEADRIDAPDLWAEVRRRAVESPAWPQPAELPWTRIGTVAVAFTVFAAAALFAWDLSHPEPVPGPPRPALEPVDLAAELGPGWTELPPPPEVRSSSATAWTGSQLIVWGGYIFEGSGDKSPRSDGFVFDAASRTWADLPPSPLAARAAAGSVWTGTELVIWGGWDGGTGVLGDGAAYDPAARTWRRLAPAPIESKAPLAAWTGEEMIVWGTAIRFPSAPMDGAAYDPASDTWRRIADAPIRLTDSTPVWTGEEMIVFGAALDGNNHAETETAVGAAYDPATDTWRELPPSELSPQAHTAAWPGSGEMIAWDYDQASAAYDPAADAWRQLQRVPLRFSECYPESVAINGYVFGNFCGQMALYSSADDAWSEITRERLKGWVLEPVAAGDVFAVMGHSLELSEETGREFDTTMLAYVPPHRLVEEEVRQFFPARSVVGTETRLPLVFPDGSRATLVYSTELDLRRLGVHPQVSYLWKEYPPPRFPVLFLHDPQASIASHVKGLEPVATSGLDPGIEVWEMSEKWQELRQLFQGHWLRYTTRSWTALVAVGHPDRVEEVVRNISIVETSDGYPIVRTSGPIELSRESGEGEGPMLAIGSTLDPAILMWLEPCTGGGTIEGSGRYGSACLGEGRVFASIYGDRAFVRGVVDGLRVEDFVPA